MNVHASVPAAGATATAGQPGVLGRLLPLAAYQSAGKLEVLFMSSPSSKAAKPGLVWLLAAAWPVENTAIDWPYCTAVPPKSGRIDRCAGSGALVPSARLNWALITPQRPSVSVAVWHRSIALA